METHVLNDGTRTERFYGGTANTWICRHASRRGTNMTNPADYVAGGSVYTKRQSLQNTLAGVVMALEMRSGDIMDATRTLGTGSHRPQRNETNKFAQNILLELDTKLPSCVLLSSLLLVLCVPFGGEPLE
jgi:hypothetical protein